MDLVIHPDPNLAIFLDPDLVTHPDPDLAIVLDPGLQQCNWETLLVFEDRKSALLWRSFSFFTVEGQ